MSNVTPQGLHREIDKTLLPYKERNKTVILSDANDLNSRVTLGALVKELKTYGMTMDDIEHMTFIRMCIIIVSERSKVNKTKKTSY